MAWLIASAILIGALALLPLVLRVVKRSARGKGGLAGATLGLGLIFAYLFEPAKAAATEEVEKQKEVGSAEKSWGSEKF